jgi:hypothetical protein
MCLEQRESIKGNVIIEVVWGYEASLLLLYRIERDRKAMKNVVFRWDGERCLIGNSFCSLSF